MNKKLKNIKVLVWDVDGTLYQSQSYYKANARAEINLLAKTKGISIDKAAQLLKEKKRVYKSATRTLVELGCGDIKRVGKAIEVKDKEKHFQKDPKLLKVFKKLTQFRHVVLRNGTHQGTLETLKILGFGKFWPFEKVFGVVDDFETVKPDPIIFEKILEYTRLPADQHLMIGDRVGVDLVPAKKLGMKTCLVFGKTDDKNVDVCLSRVYDVVEILK